MMEFIDKIGPKYYCLIYIVKTNTQLNDFGVKNYSIIIIKAKVYQSYFIIVLSITDNK